MSSVIYCVLPTKGGTQYAKSCTIPYQKSGSVADFTVRGRSHFMKEGEHEHP